MIRRVCVLLPFSTARTMSALKIIPRSFMLHRLKFFGSD
jgi:hypothetical protein